MDRNRIETLRAKARLRIAVERELRELERLPLRRFTSVDELFAVAMAHGPNPSRPTLGEE